MRKPAQALGFSLLAALLLAGNAPAFATAQIVIVNTNGPGVGFNDTTPATPVGGNTGTTVGQQRLIAFQNAADIWGSILSSPVPIYIQASFQSLPCSATSGVLGAASTIQVFANFPHAPLRNTWYPVALANALAGGDLAPGANGTDADDIFAVFNSDLGKANCLTSAPWYYGLDDNHGNGVDLVTVLLHEFGHGLGFAGFYDVTTGELLAGHPDVFSNFTYSTTLRKAWPRMTNAQRMAATIDSGHLVWTGKNVTAAAKQVLQAGTPLVTVNAPASLGSFAVGTATFGPSLTSPGVKGLVVNAQDEDEDGPGGASTATDGCSPIANDLSGKIALIDRGSCNFTVKVKNAQNAGAIGVILVNNVPGGPPPGLSGTDATLTIPAVLITQADGNKLRATAARGKAQATIGINPKVLAGANAQGQVLLFAPNPVAPGSSYSHWDISAFPNLLMEPAINADLTHGVDLTRQALIDIGWTLDGNAVAGEETAGPPDGSP
ncbi:MAG TPA: PA domain-containing protein [Thermoanaerobaculia bacterium]